MGNKAIALIGYMATGKTTIGKQVAQKINFEFVDTDALIVEQQSKSIADIFKSQGEIAFRKMEKEVLDELVHQKNILIATGGGIILDAENRQKLEEHTFLVTLTAKPNTIFERTVGDAKRPLLKGGKSFETIVEMMKVREDFYNIGHLILSTDQKSEQICVDQIIEAYQKKMKNYLLFCLECAII